VVWQKYVDVSTVKMEAMEKYCPHHLEVNHARNVTDAHAQDFVAND
jgi:hypothetical protein